MNAETLPADTPGGPSAPPAPMVAASIVAGAVALSFAPCLADLVRTWWEQPSYSHGFLVIPIAVWILYQRRGQLPASAARPRAEGWVVLALLLAARSYFFEKNETWFEEALIPLVAASLILAMAGWRVLLWAAPGLLFLFLMLPFPASINNLLAVPLQTVATLASTNLLGATGLPVFNEGNVIFVGREPLEVARACNGLSMLLSFVTLITAVVLLSPDRPVWERVVLLLSTVPIALAANILRIVATAWCYYLFGPKAVVNYLFGKTTVGELGHDAAGWGMMPIALLMVWLESKCSPGSSCPRRSTRRRWSACPSSRPRGW